VLLVLGGRLDAALKEIRDGSARSGDKLVRTADGSLAAEVLIPILLAAGVDATRHDGFPGSVMARQLEAAEALVDRKQYSSFVRYRFDEDDDQNDETQSARADLALADLLVEALNCMTIPTGKRRSYLDAGATLAADAVKRIVENKDRRHYTRAAALAVAHAEAVVIAQGQAAGDAAAEAAQSRYPRHVAYRSELMSARTSSSLLTSAAPISVSGSARMTTVPREPARGNRPDGRSRSSASALPLPSQPAAGHSQDDARRARV
jgi:hypothetical protein